MVKYAKGTSSREIAAERIEILLGQARAYRNSDAERAARYVRHTRDIASKQRIRLAPDQKRLFCHHCGTYIVPGTTSRVRTAHGRVSITCTVCGNVVRIPLKKKISE